VIHSPGLTILLRKRKEKGEGKERGYRGNLLTGATNIMKKRTATSPLLFSRNRRSIRLLLSSNKRYGNECRRVPRAQEGGRKGKGGSGKKPFSRPPTSTGFRASVQERGGEEKEGAPSFPVRRNQSPYRRKTAPSRWRREKKGEEGKKSSISPMTQIRGARTSRTREWGGRGERGEERVTSILPIFSFAKFHGIARR